MMANGEVLTVTLLATNGGTAYAPLGTHADGRCKIDGTDTTVNWRMGRNLRGGSVQRK